MANTAVPAVEIPANTGTNIVFASSGTAIAHANTHVITPAGPIEEMLILVVNTTNSQKVATLVAGDNPPADMNGLGSKTLTLGAGDSTATFGTFGPMTSAQFLQSDGTVQITVASGMTGFIIPLQLSAKA